MSRWKKVSFAEMVTFVATYRAPDTAPTIGPTVRHEQDDPMFLVEAIGFPHLGGGEVLAAWASEPDPHYEGNQTVFYVREEPF